ncbi:DUF1893 domain-containing protein [Clostridium sp. D33t1_170424_F3]|uniref:DUF1893 domain-containing protein n=1 Tax=Clostridium sp. D33t1_170424_F3 TaxID=2787099 RepID=UPI0018AC0EE5|nr:DUF1893 domain-containing protein [Clostridium sp. D33t1_170424_F3]
MNDWENAIRRLEESAYTCVLCKGETVYTSEKRGVAPLVGWITSGVDLRGFSAADKIVGKAAALLFALAGVKRVYAPVMTETALAVFARHGIEAHCQTITKQIINRAGTGPCPMERTVSSINDPEKALKAIQQTMEQLSAMKNASGK